MLFNIYTSKLHSLYIVYLFFNVTELMPKYYFLQVYQQPFVEINFISTIYSTQSSILVINEINIWKYIVIVNTLLTYSEKKSQQSMSMKQSKTIWNIPIWHHWLIKASCSSCLKVFKLRPVETELCIAKYCEVKNLCLKGLIWWLEKSKTV